MLSYTALASLCDVTDKLDLKQVYKHKFTKNMSGERDTDYLFAALAS